MVTAIEFVNWNTYIETPCLVIELGIPGPRGIGSTMATFTDVSDSVTPASGHVLIGDGGQWIDALLDSVLVGADPAGSALAVSTALTDALIAGLATKAAASHTHSPGDISGGTTGQFLRGDGTWSNALTGAIIAPTGTFTTVFGTSLQTGIVGNTGALSIGGGQVAGFTYGGLLELYGNSTGLPGNIYLTSGSISGSSTIIRGHLGTPVATFNNTNLTLARDLQGVTATFSGAVAIGSTLTLGNAVAVHQSAGSIQFTTTSKALVGPSGNAGNLSFCGGSGGSWLTGATVLAIGNSAASIQGYLRLFAGATAGARVEIYDSATAIQSFWNTTGQNLAGAFNINFGAGGTPAGTSNSITGAANGLVCNAVSGSSVLMTVAGLSKATVSAAALSLNAIPLVLGNSGTSTPAQNEMVGTGTGNKYNVSTGLYHELTAGGVVCAQFGRGGLGVSGAGRFTLGGWGRGATYDNTQSGIDATTNAVSINIGTGGSFTLFQAGSGGGTPIRTGYSPLDGGVNSVYAWGIGSWACALVGGTSGIGSSAGGSMWLNVATSGTFKYASNGIERMAWTHVGGIMLGQLAAPTVLANSSTTSLMTATSRYGILEIYTNTGERCAVHVASTGTLTFAPSIAPTAAFEIAAAPTTGAKLALTIVSGSLQIIAGNAAGTTIGANFRGI